MLHFFSKKEEANVNLWVDICLWIIKKIIHHSMNFLIFLS